MTTHRPSRTRRRPTPVDGPADERRSFFGRRGFELARDPACILDFEGVFRDANPALERALGYSREELLGADAESLVHPDDWQRTVEEARKLAAGGHETSHFENRYRRADGTWVWLEWAAHAVPVEGLIYASARNMSARKAREAELEHAAHVDPLTGLANRRGFERALERELAAAQRHGLCPALVVVDLDRFKIINDLHGHTVGDDLLVVAAGTLEETLRASDLAARIGGDEFAVLLPDCDRETAEMVGGKIIAALRSRYVDAMGRKVRISASGGVAVLGQDGIATGAELIAAADQAMYRAKRGSRSLAVHDGATR